MDRIFRCPHCGVRTRVSPRLVGRRGPCFRCGVEAEISEQTLEPISVGSPAASPISKSKPNNGDWQAAEIWEGSQPRHRQWGRWAVAILILVFAFGLVLIVSEWAIPAIKRSEEQAEMGRRLRRVALALEAYHDAHGSWPPAVTYDDNGRPMHSWRALLIPYLDDAGVMGGYDFSQPWDSPVNATLHAVRFPAFLPPDSEIGAGLHHTGFMVIVGAKTAFPPRGHISQASLPKDLHDLVLVLEVNSSGTHWLEPSDLDWESSNFQIGGGAGAPGGSLGGGAWVATADGEVEWLGEDVTAEQLLQRAVCN